MAHCLDGLRLSADFDSRLTLVARDGALQCCANDAIADIRLSGARGTLLDLIAGRVTLTETLRSGTLELAGPQAALARALLAAEYFVGALLRIRAATQLLADLEG